MYVAQFLTSYSGPLLSRHMITTYDYAHYIYRYANDQHLVMTLDVLSKLKLYTYLKQ